MEPQRKKRLVRHALVGGAIVVSGAIICGGAYVVGQAKIAVKDHTFLYVIGGTMVLVGVLVFIGALRSAYSAPVILQPADPLPDFLTQFNQPVFDCGGMGFVLVPEILNGQFTLAVNFQNRFQNDATTHLFFGGPLGMQQDVTFSCPGGAYGTLSIPFAVPKNWLGRNAAFGISGTTRYPSERGPLVRPFQGFVIEPPINRREEGAMMLLVFLLGYILILNRSPLLYTIPLPNVAAEHIQSTAVPVARILWRPSFREPVQMGTR